MALIQVKGFFLDKKLIEDVMKTLMGGTVSVAKCSNLRKTLLEIKGKCAIINFSAACPTLGTSSTR